MYIKDKTGIRQTATNAAVAMVSAFVNAGLITDTGLATETVTALRDELYSDLEAIVDADNALFKAEAEANPPAKSRKTTASKAAASSGGGELTLEQARSLVLNFGKFKGQTLGDVYDMPASEAAEFGHGTGDKAGKTYVEWLSTNENNDYAAKRALVILEAARATSASA